MLFSVILGNQGLITNDWELIEDKYKNTLITNNSIKQKIRLGKNVEKKLELAYSSANTKAYYLGTSTFISNNYSNMNLSLMNFWSQNEEDLELHSDDHIAFITLSNRNYKLLAYDNLGNEIVQTYKKINEYQGCAFTFKYFGCKLFKIYAKDLNLNKYVEILISVDDEGKIQVTKDVVEEKNLVFKLNTTFKNLVRNKRVIHFKMSTESGKLLTKAYITDKDSEAVARELTKDINGAEIVVIEGDSQKLTDNDIKNINSIIHSNTRAVTLIGTDLPRDFCKNFRILYLFKYFDDNGVLRCIKSN